MPEHAFGHVIREISGHGKYFCLPELKDPRVAKLPYSIRVLLEAAVRNCDEFEVRRSDVENILNWKETSRASTEIPFKPARVILQDFTGVPAVVDLAAMRDAMARLGGDPSKINPLIPTDLVVDHSIIADAAGTLESIEINEMKEFERNEERFAFLKWGAQAFRNMLIVCPGSGIVHQVNLEYLARVVFSTDGWLYPDSLVGTDSHTTMIDGLGVVGWGVGGIEAEAVMLGQPISMVLPEVIGFKLTGTMPPSATATDLVLMCTSMLRKKGVVGKFVEFFGTGCASLTIADRATISNMSPEYGATMGYFAVDEQTTEYLRQTGRDVETVDRVVKYFKAQGMFRDYEHEEETKSTPDYTDVLHLDLSQLEPCVAGPKRPHDMVPLKSMQKDFRTALTSPVGFKGFGLGSGDASVNLTLNGKSVTLRHGSVVIAAITSCTNTSNPSVMLGAGLLARNAVERGLLVPPFVKTTLSPGSGVVLQYLKASGLLPSLERLGFFLAGFGCMTCIGNSGELQEEIAEAIEKSNLVVSAVLSGNRNFEGRVHPLTRANYLASPPLVVAYALAGTTDIDLLNDPIQTGADGTPVYLKDIWPTKDQLLGIEREHVGPHLFKDCYSRIAKGTDRWNALKVPSGDLFKWSEASTYIHNPPFFQLTEKSPAPIKSIDDAYCLLCLGDSITTDHISPAGKIAANSPAAKFLIGVGVRPADFNSYGSRRGNDQIMARGTFANIRLINQLSSKPGPFTRHIPSGEEMPIFDAAMRYKQEGSQLVVLAGREYGSGSSRDWAAKGPLLQGVAAVIAQSFERIHRSNLVGMGILPLEFADNQSLASLKLTGEERLSVDLKRLGVREKLEVKVKEGKSFWVVARLDTEVEVEYFRHGGILQYVLRKLLA